MNMKIVGISVAVLVSLVVLAGVLMPVLDDAQTNLGDPISVTNGIKTDSPKYTVWDGSDIVLAYDPVTTTYTVNGDAMTFSANTQRIIIASNDFAARNGGTSDSPQLQSQYVDLNDQLINKAFTLTVTDKAYALTLNGVDYTGSMDWLVYANDDGTANLGQIPQGNTFYTSNKNDVIVLGNIYTTGDNDTFYSYYMGDLTVNSTYADSSSVTINKTLASGYTDIYTTTISVNIGDETFTPYYVITPITVEGHESSGASYDLLGVIPLLVIVAILLGVVALIVRSRLD